MEKDRDLLTIRSKTLDLSESQSKANVDRLVNEFGGNYKAPKPREAKVKAPKPKESKFKKWVKSKIVSKQVLKKEPRATIVVGENRQNAFYKKFYDSERRNLLSWK